MFGYKLLRCSKLVFCGVFLLLTLQHSTAKGEIVDFIITNIEPAFGGASFGRSGKYTKIEGVAIGVLNPNDPLNSVIVDLDKAPTNVDGLVEYSVEVAIAKPEGKGNGSLIYSVLNRGRKLDLYFFNWIPEIRFFTNSLVAEDVGDGLAMKEGFTFVWSGWDGSIQPGGGRLVANFPVAEVGGTPIVDRNLIEFTDTGTDAVFTVKLPHPAANLDVSQATLTVRQLEGEPRTIPGDLSFSYVDDDETIEITRPAGFDSGAIYELIYPAFDFTRIRDALGNIIDENGVFGIGFASVRDLTSFLRHDDGVSNPLRDAMIDTTIMYGYSQAGRMIKDFIYLGFNEDEGGRMVFDGAMPVVSGSARTFVNERFAKPGNFTSQHQTHLQPGDQFPFTYGVLYDPVSDSTDGILKRCMASATCPRVMHMDTDSEIRNRRASLVVTDLLELDDLSLPENVRVYWPSSSTHIPFDFVTFSNNLQRIPGLFGGEPVKNFTSPVDQRPIQRALLLALDEWVAEGTPPPASRHGLISDGTLVPMADVVAQFPGPIPDFTFTDNFNAIRQTDYILQADPLNPYLLGDSYPVLFSSVDEDGNQIPGIRLPRVENPIGTYTGWNPRAAGHAENDLSATSGSWAPLAVTHDERLLTGDPRLSLEERYGTHGGWVSKVAQTANELVREGYLLPRDKAKIISEAAQQKSMP